LLDSSAEGLVAHKRTLHGAARLTVSLLICVAFFSNGLGHLVQLRGVERTLPPGIFVLILTPTHAATAHPTVFL
jgi:hypothetical protein